MIKLKSNTVALTKKFTLPFETDRPFKFAEKEGVKGYVSDGTIGLRTIAVD